MQTLNNNTYCVIKHAFFFFFFQKNKTKNTELENRHFGTKYKS